MVKGEASTGSLEGVRPTRVESPSSKARKFKVATTFDEQDKLMRHSIGLAEYERKLAELQQRMISVHSPYNDSMMIDVNMLAASNENSFIEQPEFEEMGSPIIEEDNLNPYPATRLLSSNSSRHRKIINPALCNLDHQLLPMSDEKNYQPPKIIKKVKRLSKVVG